MWRPGYSWRLVVIEARILLEIGQHRGRIFFAAGNHRQGILSGKPVNTEARIFLEASRHKGRDVPGGQSIWRLGCWLSNKAAGQHRGQDCRDGHYVPAAGYNGGVGYSRRPASMKAV
jgi:hypothetical protein